MIAGTSTARPDRSSGGPARPLPWTAIAWFAALTALLYGPVLYNLARQWATDDDMGHGFFVPVVAGYIVWRRRAVLASTPTHPAWWGLAVVLWAGFQLYIATLGAELFLQRTSLVIAIWGMVLFLGGLPLLRELLFPLSLLFLMVPIPAIIYNQITFPLQMFASRVAEQALSLLGIPVLGEGNVLELPNQKLSVVEACSGIRSLLTLTFLALVYAYLFDPKVWMRAALLAATIPIAIAANAARVTITGVLTEYDPKLAEGVFHTAEGWVMFLIAFTLLVITHYLVNKVYGAVRGK